MKLQSVHTYTKIDWITHQFLTILSHQLPSIVININCFKWKLINSAIDMQLNKVHFALAFLFTSKKTTHLSLQYIWSYPHFHYIYIYMQQHQNDLIMYFWYWFNSPFCLIIKINPNIFASFQSNIYLSDSRTVITHLICNWHLALR